MSEEGSGLRVSLLKKNCWRGAIAASLGIALIIGAMAWGMPVAQASVSNKVLYDLSPAVGEKKVAVNSMISVYLKKEMKTASINVDTVYLKKSGSSSDTPAWVGYNESTNELTIEPDSPLSFGSAYTVYMTDSIRYADETRISPQSWQFFTVEAPALIADRNPASGKTVIAPEVVSFGFTQEMDEATIDEDSVYLRDETKGKEIAVDVYYDLDTYKVTMEAKDDFIIGHRYSVNITAGVMYKDGTKIAAQKWSFLIKAQPAEEKDAQEIPPPQEEGTPSNQGDGNVPDNYPAVWMNGSYIDFPNGKPYIKNGRTMLPMRILFEQMGAEVQWDDAQQKVAATINGNTIELHIGSKIAYMNGAKVALDAAAEISQGSTMVPLRFIGEGLGKQVKWDSINKIATVED